MVDHDISERAASLFVPDTMLASQYFDRIRRRKDLTGEQRLMCAVIEDAVDIYLKDAAAPLRGPKDPFVEAERWIESTDRSWLYAFETICDYLALDADYLRRGLRRWKERASAAAVPASMLPAAAPAADVSEFRRASNE